MPIVFSNDNASSYLNTLYETPAPSVSSGYLYGWGNNTIGQIGNGTSSTTYVSEPVKILKNHLAGQDWFRPAK